MPEDIPFPLLSAVVILLIRSGLVQPMGEVTQIVQCLDEGSLSRQWRYWESQSAKGGGGIGFWPKGLSGFI
jgi:hypothetical protein